MNIIEGGLEDTAVIDLLEHHLDSARAQTAVGSAHALDLTGLRSPDINFWSIWHDGKLAGVGAMKRLDPTHGEVKSMHTVAGMRGRGVGSEMLRHIITVARDQGIRRLSLETGSWPYFEPAWAFYRKHGFKDCAPFGSYSEDPNSVFMTLELP